jgi:UDP-glucose 4-epimerase
MKVVLTGASGFMGGAFLSRLLLDTRVKEVVLLAGSEDSVSSLRTDYPGLQVAGPWPVGGPGTDEALHNADVLFHFAWSTMPSTAAADPLRDIRENVMSGFSLLDRVVAKGVKRFVFLSSGGTVYGEAQYLPIDEGHPTMPMTPYGISKLSFEHYLRQHADRHGYGHLVLRPGNVYGNLRAEGRPQGVIEHWLKRLSGDRPLEVWNELSLVRDYVYIDDMVDVLERVLDGPAVRGAVNVGTGVGTSLEALAGLMARVTGRSLQLTAAQVPVRAVGANILHTGRLMDMFGLVPSTPLAVGVERLWHRSLGMSAADDRS